jgi:hypothetical protein
MGVGLLVSLTLPGVVLLLVAVAFAEQLWSRLGRRSRLTRRRRHALSASGMDVFSAALDPGRAVDLEEQRSRAVTREDTRDGAPPYARIDLASGIALLDGPRRVPHR